MWLFLKNLLFTVIVPGFVAGWVPLVFLRHRAPAPDVLLPWHYLAMPFLLLGAIIYTACVWQFGSNGRGTPAPIDPPRKLVVRGCYRWVRNPMYLGVLLFVLGEAVFFRETVLFLYFVFLASGLQLFVVLFEEPGLRRRFGAIYQDYCNVTNRWLPSRPRPALQTVPPFGSSRR